VRARDMNKDLGGCTVFVCVIKVEAPITNQISNWRAGFVYYELVNIFPHRKIGIRGLPNFQILIQKTEITVNSGGKRTLDPLAMFRIF